MKIYLVSLYYDSNRVTGANKRFDKVGKYLNEYDSIEVILVVGKGHTPQWSKEACCKCIEVSKPLGSRVLQLFVLEKVLFESKDNIIINDFMPIPLIANYRNCFYQLIHDIRNFTEFNRSPSRILGSLFQKLSWKLPRKIITVSNFTKNEILKHIKCPESNVIVSYNGFDEKCSDKNKLIKDIDILYIATYEKRKNHENLIRSLYMCKNKGLNLNVTFIGRDLGFLTRVKSLAEELGVVIDFLESVTESELQDIYSRTLYFISPSYYEGFGMPLIEAYSLGCRIICSDIIVFKEIGGDNFSYFDPASPEAISDAICENIHSAQMPACMFSKDGFLNKFKWKFIVEKLLQDIN